VSRLTSMFIRLSILNSHTCIFKFFEEFLLSYIKCTNSRISQTCAWLAEKAKGIRIIQRKVYQFQTFNLTRLAGCRLFSFFKFCLTSTSRPWPSSTLSLSLDCSSASERCRNVGINNRSSRIVQKIERYDILRGHVQYIGHNDLTRLTSSLLILPT